MCSIPTAFATDSTNSAAKITRSSPSWTKLYSKSAFTAIARLDGIVQGVVVQMMADNLPCPLPCAENLASISSALSAGKRT